jgi:hypothetical protein
MRSTALKTDCASAKPISHSPAVKFVDLTNQFEQPFEHEEKLAAATKRQQEIVATLDITKNQASSTVGQDGLQQECEALETKPRQNVRAPLSRSHAVVRNC